MASEFDPRKQSRRDFFETLGVSAGAAAVLGGWAPPRPSPRRWPRPPAGRKSR